MSRRLADERGFALVPAVMALVVVLLLGTALLAGVNVQTSQTAVEREQEGSFQAAESALTSQTAQLVRTWPSSAATAYPVCDQSTAPTARCSGSALTSNFTATGAGGGPNAGSDFATAPQWSSRVIDDVQGPEYYDDAIAARSDAVAYDGNANGAVWIRSEASVGGRRSVVVSLVQRSQQAETLPNASIVAGFFETSNNGKKTIVNAGTNPTGPVAVRCSGGPGISCLDYREGQLVPPDSWNSDYVDGTGLPSATNRSSLDSAALARLKERAQSLGTYFATGCPPSLTGELIYVENSTNGTCKYTGNADYNTEAEPGVLILGGGVLDLGGRADYFGLIYNANRQGAAPASGPCTEAFKNDAVLLGGNTTVYGAIFVDQCGGVTAGSSGNNQNFVFDIDVFEGLKSFGEATAVENSFRILPTSG